MFSSTLPSISLNPTLLVRGLSGKSEVPKSAIVNVMVVRGGGWVKKMQGAKKSSYSPLSSAGPGINYFAFFGGYKDSGMTGLRDGRAHETTHIISLT